MADLNAGALTLALDDLYEAAAVPEFWPSALDRLSHAAGGTHSLVFFAPPDCRYTCSTNMNECVETFVQEGWEQHDARTRRALKVLNAGQRVTSDEMLFKPGELDREPIQNDLFNRFDLRCFFGFDFIPGQILASIERGHHQIAEWEIEQLSKCIPHFQRVGRLALARGVGVGQGAMATLDTMKSAAILVDHQGRIIRMNEFAEAICPDVLSIREGIMRPHHAAAVAPFERLVRRAAASDLTPSADVIDHVPLPRENKRPIVAHAVPLKGAAHDIFQQAKAIVMLVDLEASTIAGAARWCQVFGMTRMEGRVAERIAEGHSINNVADMLHLTHHTVRSHLTSIFRKTGTNRQSQVATLLGKIPDFKI